MARRTVHLFMLLTGLIWSTAALGQSYSVTMNQGQVNPPTGSPATGSGTLILDAAKMLSFDVSFSGLTGPEIAAHIHGPANPGVNAGIAFPLPLGSPKVGTLGPLTAAEEANLNSGLYYINIHSTNFPSGEIRGQIMMQSVSTEVSSWGRVKALFEGR